MHFTQKPAHPRFQIMISVVTIAMYLLYSQTRELHDKLTLETKIQVLEKYRFRELLGFVYLKITTILQILLMGTKVRTFKPLTIGARDNPDQLVLFRPF